MDNMTKPNRSDFVADFAGATRGPLSSAAAAIEAHGRLLAEHQAKGLEVAQRVRALEAEVVALRSENAMLRGRLALLERCIPA